jgi:hypothetical protein
MDWGTLPQWITSVVALSAACIALKSIGSQREIARKRAAMDFFAKTEMDKHTLDAHAEYLDGVAEMKKHLGEHKACEGFVGSDSYRKIRAYLNLHELMAVGINQNVFDDEVCYDFWKGELLRAYSATRALIKCIQEQPDEKYTYIELTKVAERWTKGRTKHPVARWRAIAAGLIGPLGIDH